MLRFPIHLQEYDYPLPPERIALHPLPRRDESKLLILDSTGKIQETHFNQISAYLPEKSLLVFNNTKVMYARLLFQKENAGSHIEIFCLEPVFPSTEINIAFSQTNSCRWKCLVGNKKKWKNGKLGIEIHAENMDGMLYAENQGEFDGAWLIEFSWYPENTPFYKIIECCGKVPLPPYIKRDVDINDPVRYQTIYADPLGSVAAPTAGLHFSNEVMNSLKTKQVSTTFLTLHVGAGTFKPIDVSEIETHVMHSENIIIQKEWVEDIIKKIEEPIIAVGTTSVRTIESAYWIGHQLHSHKPMAYPFHLNQWYPYTSDENVSPLQAFNALLQEMEIRKTSILQAYTQLIILPSYPYQIVTGMITNFHQPRSTLLLLVSAFIGEKWKEVYQYALQNRFRFLSYGDACLFLPKHKL